MNSNIINYAVFIIISALLDGRYKYLSKDRNNLSDEFSPHIYSLPTWLPVEPHGHHVGGSVPMVRDKDHPILVILKWLTSSHFGEDDEGPGQAI